MRGLDHQTARRGALIETDVISGTSARISIDIIGIIIGLLGVLLLVVPWAGLREDTS